MAKNIVNRTGEQGWALYEITGGRSSRNPGSVKWMLPGVFNIHQGGSINIRQYAVNATGLVLNVTGLPTGVTYNSGTESLDASVEASGSSTATFTIDGEHERLVTVTATEQEGLGNPIWMDDFNYVVDPESFNEGYNDTANNPSNPFFVNGPWDHGRQVRGDMYTVDPLSIEGNDINPSPTSSRVLAIEALPGTFDEQSDLELGMYGPDFPDPSGDDYVFPAECWIQGWWFMEYNEDRPSRIARAKFLYPCRDGHGSCNNLGWLVTLSENTSNPHCVQATEGTGVYMMNNGSDGQPDSGIEYSFQGSPLGGCSDGAWKQGNTTPYLFTNNQWHLWKIHMDNSGEQTVFEAWARPYGSQTWTKFADWRGGVTPETYSATIASDRRRGHNAFRFPSTIAAGPVGHPSNLDAWFYFADLMACHKESDLRVYQDGAPVEQPLFFDNFEYETPVEDFNGWSDNPFVNNGGWTGFNDVATDISTVTFAEFQANTGFNALGNFPTGGTRCVRYDFSNQYGGTNGYLYINPPGGIPANFWMQFWYYMPHEVGYEQSRVQDRFKWVYPGGGTGHPRILLSGSVDFNYTYQTPLPGAYQDESANGPESHRLVTDGSLVFCDRDSSLGDDTVNDGAGPEYTDPYYGFPTENSWKIGPNMINDTTQSILYPNTWYLVKLHYDVSVLGEGTFEMWMREYGQSWRKTHEWISGQNTPVLPAHQHSGGSFEWPTTYTENFDGFKIGSTIGWFDDNTRMYVYMDDFVLGTTEESLPTYDDYED